MLAASRTLPAHTRAVTSAQFTQQHRTVAAVPTKAARSTSTFVGARLRTSKAGTRAFARTTAARTVMMAMAHKGMSSSSDVLRQLRATSCRDADSDELTEISCCALCATHTHCRGDVPVAFHSEEAAGC
jgi:hypothetical protein